MMAEAVAGFVFLGMLATVALLGWSLRARRQAATLELGRRLGPRAPTLRVVRTPALDPLGGLLGPAGRWLHQEVLRAGSTLTVGRLVVAMGASGLLAVLLLARVVGAPASLPGVLVGALPVVWLRRQAARRERDLTAQLPDAIDLITRALRSGHAFAEALRSAAVETAAPLGEELSTAAEEYRLGLGLRECLEGLVDRVPRNFDLRLFTSAVLLHRETGGNLVEILDQLAETLRERVIFEQKVKALTAEVRASAFILATLPFLAAAALMVTSPHYLEAMIEPGAGPWMLAGAGLSLAIGIALMQRIAQVTT